MIPLQLAGLSSGHLVFDVKMDFTRKTRWVKDDHRTPDLTNSTFAGVVSRESVRIALTYAALNKLDVCVADIKNAYLQAPSSEKHYIICGAEFGVDKFGKRALIRRAVYGGKLAGSDFWKHLRSCCPILTLNRAKQIQISGCALHRLTMVRLIMNMFCSM